MRQHTPMPVQKSSRAKRTQCADSRGTPKFASMRIVSVLATELFDYLIRSIKGRWLMSSQALSIYEIVTPHLCFFCFFPHIICIRHRQYWLRDGLLDFLNMEVPKATAQKGDADTPSRVPTNGLHHYTASKENSSSQYIE